jgi:hypothetical protein
LTTAKRKTNCFAYGTARLLEIEGLKIYGRKKKTSFNIEATSVDIDQPYVD